MKYSHINYTWKDIHEKLFNYVDRYFELRVGNTPEDEKAPLKSSEKGALLGYLQTFDDKNDKWVERVNFMKDILLEKYTKKGIEAPQELNVLEIQNLSIEDRIKLPLKALYMLSYHELLQSDESVATYDEAGNFDKINLSPEKLELAINLFALTGALANRVAHSSSISEESIEAFETKHQMLAFLLTAVYDYNQVSDKKVDCKFAKLPSSSDGHAYPTFTLKLSSPENLGKVSLHFGGSLRNVKHVI